MGRDRHGMFFMLVSASLCLAQCLIHYYLLNKRMKETVNGGRPVGASFMENLTFKFVLGKREERERGMK